MFKSAHSSSIAKKDGSLSTPFASRPFRARPWVSTDYPQAQHRSMTWRKGEYYSLYDPHLAHYFRAKALSALDRPQSRPLSSISFRSVNSQSSGLSSRSAWMSSSRPPPPLCVYKVTVRTGSAPGTISRAYITLQGSKGTLKRRRLAKGGKKDFTFVSGRSDVFRIRGKDVGDITNVTIESDGLKKNDAWFVDFVTVVDEMGKKWMCPCNQWLSLYHTDCQLSRTLKARIHRSKSSEPPLTLYQVEIHTGDVRGGGTGANVFVTLEGTKDTSSKWQLHGGDGGEFERGSVVSTQLECQTNLGEIKRLRIGHDNSGFGPDWFLDHVVLCTADDPQDKLYFKCGRWLSRNQGDGLIECCLQASQCPPDKNESKCYMVTTITGNRRGAGTKANVFITLFGEKGSSEEQFLDNDPANFERGRKDTFSINCSDLGTLTKVVIGHDNAGVGPSWFLEGVEVAESGGRAGVVTFPCGRWLEMCGGCGGELEVELFPDVKRSNKNEELKYLYEVVVSTGERPGAGTTANVSLVLCGREEASEKLALDNGCKSFLSGQTDSFEVATPTLFSPLESISVSHDNTGPSPGWFLHQVRVKCMTTGEQWVFPCDKWLCLDTGDARIVRELHPLVDAKSNCSLEWEIRVFTSDLRGAGTDANVTLQIHGSGGVSEPIPLGDNLANFEQGECDVFKGVLVPTSIGTVEAVTVSHDGTNPYPDWHLEKILLKNTSTHDEYLCYCGKWLSADNGNSVKLNADPIGTLMNGEPPPINDDRDVTDIGRPIQLGVTTIREEGDSSITNQYLHQLRYEQASSMEEPASRALPSPASQSTRDVSNEKTIPYTVHVLADARASSSPAPFLELILCGDEGTSLPIILESLGSQPTPGTPETYSVEGTDVGQITSIKVRLLGTSMTPWHVNKIVIHNPTSGHTHHFPCGRDFRPKEEEYELKAMETLDSSLNTTTMFNSPRSLSDLIAFEVKVSTADKKGAGTLNSLYLTLVGEKGPSKAFLLKNTSKNPKFQRGQTDTFQVATPPLGSLKHIQVAHCPRKRHRNVESATQEGSSGSSSSWYLFQIVLTDLVERTKFYFLCRKWVESSPSPDKLNFTQISLSNRE